MNYSDLLQTQSFKGMFIHPRKCFRSLCCQFHSWTFLLSCRRKGVNVSIGNNCVLNHCFIKSSGQSEIIIEDNCSLDYCSFLFYGGGGSVIIHQGTTINSSKGARTCLYVRGETSIEIGKNCLIAHSVDICTTDFHKVFDGEGGVMNIDSSVVIGEHVWIGKRATINKGVRIPSDSIVGASSVVTKAFTIPNVLIAGNPAVIRKQGITWKR